MRSTLDKAGITGAEIQQFGTPTDYTIRAREEKREHDDGLALAVDGCDELAADHVLQRQRLALRAAPPRSVPGCSLGRCRCHCSSLTR